MTSSSSSSVSTRRTPACRNSASTAVSDPASAAVWELAACAPAPVPFAPTAPFHDGETSRYDIVGAGGVARGAASWTWQRDGEGWRESYEVTTGPRRERGSVDLDARLAPRASHGERDGAKIDVTWGEGTITIRTRGASGRVVVEIEDDGPGIAAENLSRVFEPFFSTKGPKGTGLGLSTVYGIVKQSEGYI